MWQDVITDFLEFFSLSPDIEHINNLMPLSGNFTDIFCPIFFLAIESYIYETDFTLKKYHF